MYAIIRPEGHGRRPLRGGTPLAGTGDIRPQTVKLWLACLMLMAFVHPACAADAVARLVFESPTPEQRAVIVHVLGQEFLQGVGAFPPETVVSAVDLNGDGVSDMVAVQKGFCSNHACTFQCLLQEPSGAWEDAAAVESWAIPYMLDGPEGSMRGLVIFDHLTDDCLACSPPMPVRLAWQQDESLGTGHYVETGPVPEGRALRVTPSWDWRGLP